MNKIKKGDEVYILCGKDRGKRGSVLKVLPNGRAVVQGINMVKKYDSVVSSDLYYWLDYVDMSEQEFWNIADTFRDPRVWWIENGKWCKYNIWGEASSYGDISLNKNQIKDYVERQKNL